MRVRRGGRWTAGLLSTALLGACLGLRTGQTQDQSGAAGQTEAPEAVDPAKALENGRLVVWVVQPPVPGAAAEKVKEADVPAFRAPQPGYHEQTTGSFGQDASSYGTAAGSYGVDASSPAISVPKAAESPANGVSSAPVPGTPAWRQYHEQTAGSYGQASSSYGTDASNHGQTAGSLGQNAGSFGTDASNVGQTTGSFGNSLSTIADAGKNAPATADVKENKSAVREALEQELEEAFPDLEVRFVDVDADELKGKLMSAAGDAYPDVLVGAAPAGGGGGVQTEFGLGMLRPAVFVPDGLTAGVRFSPQIAITARARHMDAARAFAMWMSDGGGACDGCGTEQEGAAGKNAHAVEAVATDALSRLLRGGALGAEADPEMAVLAPQLARRILMTTAGSVATEAVVHVDVERVTTNGTLAAVALRVIASSERVFGVVHPLVVLRKGSDGKWRVLHLSPNLPEEQQLTAQSALMASAPPSDTEEHAGVKGVSLAAPADGDKGPPMPQLWWDNGGGAGLQVVEWEASFPGGDWSDSRLYLVPDSASRLRTQVTARFADLQGRYRWRVWSVGAEGAMKISPWRTFSVER